MRIFDFFWNSKIRRKFSKIHFGCRLFWCSLILLQKFLKNLYIELRTTLYCISNRRIPRGSTQSIQSVRTGRTGRSLSVSFLKESDQRIPLLFFCLFACECVRMRVIVFEFVKKVEMIIEHSLSDLFYFSKFLLLSLPLSECTSLFTTFGNRVLHFALPTLM